MENSNTNLPLYRIEGVSYCKMLDVVRMINHEMDETDDQTLRSILSRMKMRVCRNDLIDPAKGAVRDNTCIPGRYAVAWPFSIGYRYYAGMQEDKQSIFTDDYSKAKLYVTYREAAAAADFLDVDHDCVVLDMHDMLSEADRFRRALLVPYDADAGSENAVVPDFIP